MAEVSCDVLIVGGGTGGCAAALAATDLGLKVVLTEESDWIGGQLTSQAVPPDEHAWIEERGCTRRYREFRKGVRDAYRRGFRLRQDLADDPTFNPGGGWVSNLCHLPAIGHQVLLASLSKAISSGKLDLRVRTIVSGGAQLSGPPVPSEAQVTTESYRIRSVAILHLATGETDHVLARYFIDATELGDLIALAGAKYRTGSEGKRTLGEDHSPTDFDDPENQQALTWVFAMGYDPGSRRVIDKPESYDRWKTYRPPFWPGPFLSTDDLDPITLQPRHIPLFSDDWRCWFKYRQIFDPARTGGLYEHPITIVNWPQNDYFLAPIVDVPPQVRWERLLDARKLSNSLLYWLQTECPRPDGGTGYPGLYPVPGVLGTPDGFAKTPYIRESRRVFAQCTVCEDEVSADLNPERVYAPDFPDSVGIGSYRIDLHPSTGGDSYIDLATLPFQIPLGSMVLTHHLNLLPACKNISTTHLTNGCYRLHPVEWNIGESAGLLAAFCIQNDVDPEQVLDRANNLREFQGLLISKGVELRW